MNIQQKLFFLILLCICSAPTVTMEHKASPPKLDLYDVCNPKVNYKFHLVEKYKESNQLQKPLSKENIYSEFNVKKVSENYSQKEKNNLLGKFLEEHDYPEPSDTTKYQFVRRVLAALMYAGADPNVITHPAPLTYAAAALKDFELIKILWQHGEHNPYNRSYS